MRYIKCFQLKREKLHVLSHHNTHILCVLPEVVDVCVYVQIPSSAVEMPGSADVSGLNVQFGALDFASEPITMETTQSDSISDSTQDPIPQNSLPPRSARCVYVFVFICLWVCGYVVQICKPVLLISEWLGEM